MNINFNDTHLALTYFQKKLHDTYNDNIKINGKYYTTINNDYGFAHFVAKYLDKAYPPVVDNYTGGDVPKSQSDVISIMNYFLSDNNGNILKYGTSDDNYMMIYNEYHLVGNSSFNISDIPLLVSEHVEDREFPYVCKPETSKIYPLFKWSSDKRICEIDDFIASYLFGRTITPRSTRDEIFYVQKLFIGESYLHNTEKGVWNPKDFPEHNLTDLIVNYQKSCVNINKDNSVFVTGYFDIFTESHILLDKGVSSNGICGL